MESQVLLRSKHTNKRQQRPKDMISIINEGFSYDHRGAAGTDTTVGEIEEPISMIIEEQNQDTDDNCGPGNKGSLDDQATGTEEFGKCAECVKAVPVFAYNEINVGDHITFYGRLYDHHAIVTQKLDTNQIKIIEATNTHAGASSRSFFWGKAFIEETVKTLDFANDRINVVVYQNRKFTKAEVARRAREYYQHQKGTRDFNYNVFRNNCEHFATKCVTGNPFSIQVVKVRMVIKLFLSRGFMGISDESMRNKKLFEKNFICSSCNGMNKRLLSVSVKPIMSADDVKVGDVIRYTYFYLHHEAVVLEMKGVDRSSVRVSIAHYAFRGFLKYRKIIEEAITIRLGGSCSVLQYQSPQYEVFPPEEVVKRAKSRIGEQRFVFFSNDSSHFSRWCKLPRKRSQSGTQ